MRVPRARFVLAGLVLPAAVLVAACAEAPPPTSPPPPGRMDSQGSTYSQQAGYPQQMPPGQPAATATVPGYGGIPGLVEIAPRTVPDAVAQLDRAEQLLGFVLTPTVAGEHPTGFVPPAGTSVMSSTPVPLGDPCLIACAALASMKRSADHVCEMAGDKDAACDSARARVQRAEQRVTAACPACAAATGTPTR